MEIELNNGDVQVAVEEYLLKRFPDMDTELTGIYGKREPQPFNGCDEVKFKYTLKEK